MCRRLKLAICTGLLLLFSCAGANASAASWKPMHVAASAYNSLPSQTTASHSNVAAWGDVLEPGMHAIAVSRDLIEKGLTYGTKVKIPGLSGIYVVLDKMAARWTNKIDIYMGHDVQRARDWGVRHNLRILYTSSNG